ncbi:MAG: PQQ-binding-like beta-propeller repeat protein [Planctomycetes bacterium]|nr:PQQ-binding-like beta-propeller repeat protein [Planctomycetota bacterium]
MARIFALPLLFVLTSPVGSAEQPLAWPQFRGPGASGVAEGERPPVEFGPEKNLKWKVPAPGGLSSPIIVADKLVITAFDGGKLYTIAYNRSDGNEAWRAEAPAKKIEAYLDGEGSPAASTSATDGERIVSYFGSCGLACYELAGNELWRYEMPTAETIAGFGSGVSPVIADGLVILARDELKNSRIIAIDLATGEPKWEKKRTSNSSFSTPAIWDTPDGKQIAMPGFGRLIGYDLKTGDERWHVEGMPSSCCTSPVTDNGNLFFAGWSPGDPAEADSQMPSFDDFLKENDADKNKDGVLSKEESLSTSMKAFFDGSDANKDGQFTRDEHEAIQKFMAATHNSAFALRPGGSGDVTESHVIWKQKKGLPYVASALVYAGQFVMVRDKGIVTAYDTKTGDELYQKRPAAAGSYYASPVAANGHIYFAALADGEVTVVKAGTSPPEVVAKNAPLGERMSATPAIADDTLYIRTANHLWAFAE